MVQPNIAGYKDSLKQIERINDSIGGFGDLNAYIIGFAHAM